MRWFDRLIGVFSTIILARLLSPADFGIIALASIILGMAMVLLDFGINTILVQRPTQDRDDLDTAWTLQVLQSVGVATLLALLSPLVATHYADPQLEPVVMVFALTYLVNGLTGMGPAVFQKEQRYAREAAFVMSKRLGSFAVTVVLAFWLRNYWAMVIGSLAGSIWGVLLSHAMYPVPLQFTVVRWREFVGASLWLSLRSMGAYAAQELDKFVIGSRDGATLLGAHSIANQVAAMPTSELLAPMSRALFPAMAALQHKPVELRRTYLLALGIQASLALPLSVGLALVAHDLVRVLLGEQWTVAGPIMVPLALYFGTNALTHSGTYLLTSLAKYRAQTILNWTIALALALLIFVVFPNSGAMSIAWFRLWLGLLAVLAVAWLTIR